MLWQEQELLNPETLATTCERKEQWKSIREFIERRKVMGSWSNGETLRTLLTLTFLSDIQLSYAKSSWQCSKQFPVLLYSICYNIEYLYCLHFKCFSVKSEKIVTKIVSVSKLEIFRHNCKWSIQFILLVALHASEGFGSWNKISHEKVSFKTWLTKSIWFYCINRDQITLTAAPESTKSTLWPYGLSTATNQCNQMSWMDVCSVEVYN